MKKNKDEAPFVQTTTKSTTRVRIGVALIFLGIAALAAGLVGLRSLQIKRPSKPDLIIRDISFQQEFDLQKVTVTYQNFSNAIVKNPFTILVRLNPAPNKNVYKIMGDGSWELVKEIQPGSGLYNVPVNNYYLGSKGYNTLELVSSFSPQTEVAQNSLIIEAFVNRYKNVTELNSYNNYKKIVARPNELWQNKASLYWVGYGYGYYGSHWGYGYGYGYYGY